jgi:hypothetical protein
VNISWTLSIATLILASTAMLPALAGGAAETAAPAARYREVPPAIDCHRAPARGIAPASGVAGACSRDSVPSVAARIERAPPRNAVSRDVKAAPAEEQPTLAPGDRLECPMQAEMVASKRPRHLLFLHLT